MKSRNYIKLAQFFCGICLFIYSGLSLSRLLFISNFSLFRTKSLVPWTFVHFLSYLSLSLYFELLYLDYFFISNKNLGSLRLFLSLSQIFSRLRVQLHSKQNKNARYLKIRKFDLVVKKPSRSVIESALDEMPPCLATKACK